MTSSYLTKQLAHMKQTLREDTKSLVEFERNVTTDAADIVDAQRLLKLARTDGAKWVLREHLSELRGCLSEDKQSVIDSRRDIKVDLDTIKCIERDLVRVKKVGTTKGGAK